MLTDRRSSRRHFHGTLSTVRRTSCIALLQAVLACGWATVAAAADPPPWAGRLPVIPGPERAAAERAAAARVEISSTSPEALQLAQKLGGSWRVATTAGKPLSRLVWGTGLAMPAAKSADEKTLVRLARSFVDEHPEQFAVQSDQLETWLVRRQGNKTAVIFQQLHGSVPVFGATAKVVFQDDGRLIAFESDLEPSFELDTQPRTTADVAVEQEIARSGRAGRAVSGSPGKLWAYPADRPGAPARLVWRVTWEDPESGPWMSTVDAHSGEVLAREHMRFDLEFSGQLWGPVDWLNPCDGSVPVYAYPHARVAIAGVGTTFTAWGSGGFSIPGSGTATATVTLQGIYADVVNGVNGSLPRAQITMPMTAGVPSYPVWDNTNSTQGERDIYVHVNEFRNWLQGRDFLFVNSTLNFPLRCEANVAFPFPQAYYQWIPGDEKIVFSAAIPADNFQNFGVLADVIYHEYGHVVTAYAYGGILAPQPISSIHEANSDIAAVLFAQNPLIGRGYLSNSCGSHLRTASNTMQFPADYNGFPSSGHANAPLLAGFFWDAYTHLTTHGLTGPQARDQIGKAWHDGRMMGLPNSYVDQVLWTYVADDLDGNLLNGNQHTAAWNFAADAHGFPRVDGLGANLGLFADVTAAPVDVQEGFAVAWGDYDNDGDADLYLPVTNFGLTTSATARLIRNDGGGVLTDVTPPALALGGSSTSAAWGDFDKDGDLDLFVMNGAGNKLFRRDQAAGTFADVTPASLASLPASYTVSWVDYDKDRDLDLFTGQKLFRNNGGTTFTEVTGQPLSDLPGVATFSWGDYDKDGDPDLFLVRDAQPDRLVRNNGNGTFTDVTPENMAITAANGGACAWGDSDSDGDLDLVLVNYMVGGTSRLFRNDGASGFTDVTTPTLARSRGRSVSWGDYDRDGLQDLFVTNELSDFLLRNTAGNTFQDVSGPPIWDSGFGNAATWSDYDADGDLDLYLANFPSFDPSFPGGLVASGNHLYRNQTTNSNGWLGINLVPFTSSRSGIGARVTVVANGQTHYREVSGGGERGSQNPATLFVGLGAAASVTSVQVLWPSNKTTFITNLGKNQRITLYEPSKTSPPDEYTPPLIAELEPGEIIDRPLVMAASPNPFQGSTFLKFSRDPGAPVDLAIFDVQGRKIRSVRLAASELASAGGWAWDGRDDLAASVPRGLYFVRVVSGARTEKLRLVRMP